MSSNLSKHILATVAYYDVMDYPMTAFEIWKHLLIISGEEEKEKYLLVDVIFELEGDKLKRFIANEKGFYFLKDRQGLAEERIRRNKISEFKFKRILKKAKILRFFPFIRAVAVSGRMAMKNAQEKSDWDLFIILKEGKLWTGRAIITFLLQILGLRRNNNKTRDRFCLNHFIISGSEVSIKDVFSSNEYAFLIPIYGFSQFLQFQKINNWVKKIKPNFFFENNNRKRIEDSFFSKTVKIFLEKILGFSWMEIRVKKWQIEKIKKNPKTHQDGSMIIYGNEELAFWPNFKNQGPQIFSKFKERLSEISRF